VQAGGTDMFGAVPKKPIADVYKALQAPAGEPGLFDEPAPKAKAPKTVTDDDGNKLSFPLFVDMADKGYKVLSFDNPRTYQTKGGNKYRTIEKDGVRLALNPGEVIFADPKYPNRPPMLGYGEPNQVTWHFIGVDPKQRKQGKATQAIKDLIDVADKNNYTLYGEPAQLETSGMTAEQLSNFYSKFGFQPSEVSKKIIVREPNQAVKQETKPVSEPIDFDIDKPKEKIAKEINGLTIPELAQWSIDNAPNSAARAVAIKVKKIVDEFATKNMFPDTVKVKNGTSRWKSGTRGRTSYRYSPRGVKFSLDFNGVLANGEADRLTGTNYITVLHELLHVATTGELQFIGQNSQAYKDLAIILAKVRKQVKEDIAAGKKSPVLSKIAAGSNTIKNVKELVSWGLTDTDFQLYLRDIKVGKKNNLFNDLVEAFRKLLGINEEYETALEAVVRATDQILEKPPSELRADIAKSGIRFEGQQAQGVDTSKLPPNRSRELAEAAQKVREGSMTREQFEVLVNKYAPIAPVPAPRPPASTEAMRNALATNQKDKLNPEIADGTPVGLRMDINALRKGASVVSIHQGSNTSKVGQVIGYSSVASATDVKFSNRNQQALLKVAAGEGKLPAQTMEGKYKNISPEEAFKRVNELLNDPEWTQIGVDPTRHGYFYDRANAMPVKSADELIQVGNFVLAKNAQYDAKENYLYEKVGTEEEKQPWEERETPDAFGRETALTDMYNSMRDVYDESTSPDQAYSDAYENASPAEQAILRQLKKNDMLGFDYPHQAIQAIIQEPQNFDLSTPLKSAISRLGNKQFATEEENIGKKVAAKTKQALQKRKMPEGVFSDVDPGLMDIAKPLFYPEQKTIVDKVAGMKDDFFKKLAQGVADQYRSIKDYSEVGYMQARMSKTVDGALEGLTFFGHVFNNGGALDIKKNTKGLMEILKPVGKEVDRYQMWVALNREANLPMEKRTKMPGIGELIKRRNEFAAGTIDGKNRVDVYEKVRSDMNGLNKSVLKVALDAGLIDSSRQKIEDIKSRDYLTGADREILTRPFREEIERIEAKKAMNVTEDDKQTLKDYRAIIRDINGMEKMTPDLQNELIQYYTDNPGAFERFSADINYIPFYRAMEDGDLQGASTASGLTNQQFSRELKGGERAYGDLMENTMRNWSHILSAAMKNQASNTILNDATEMGAATPNLKVQYTLDDDGKVVSRSSGEVIGDGSVKPYMTTADKGAIKVMREGQPIYYRVLDPMLLDSISSIGYMGPKSKFLDVARDFKNMLQFGVTISPAFKVRNLFRDSVSALAVTDLKKNPFANVVDGWISSDRNNPAHISALAGGAIFNFGTAYEGDQSRLIKRLLDKGVDANTILDSPEKVKEGLTVLWEKYKDWGNKSESANRMALYNQLKAKGYDHLQASFYARDLLDFSMQGAWPAFRLAAQTIPFLNARVQGLYKLGRDGVVPTSRVLYNTLTGKEIDASDAQKARSFSYTTGAVAMASMLLYLAFKDDEEYQKREQWDRDNFWWIRLPGMDFAFRIPKPFEIGAFGTMAERVLEQIVDKDAEGKAFGDSMFRMLTDTFAMNPIPQVIRPLMDIYANKDSFTGAPIESAGMERLSKQERVTDNTSPIAQALGGISSVLGDKASLSPVQVDYAIKAYFGWLGGTATQMSVYAVQPFKDGAYPDLRLMDKASQGFLKSLPTDQSRYVTAFYENNKQISQAYADMRHYAELGDSKKVQKILEKNGDKIALTKLYDKNSKEMAKVRAHIRSISSDPNMDGTTKREMIDRMKLIISDLAEQAESTRKFLKQ
jgi:GNAT superfamily N-acetyltransferase